MGFSCVLSEPDKWWAVSARAFAVMVTLAMAPVSSALAQVAIERTDPGGVAVRQHPPEVTVEQAPPSVDVRQPAPQVTVEQPEPRIEVNQPGARVSVSTPQPEVEVRQAPPRVRVEQRPPQVEVRHAAPEVRVERANAQVEVTTQAPNVVFEHGEPEVVITREPSPLLPFSAVVGRTLLAEEGPRIGVIESVRIEVRTDRLYAIVMNSAGVTTAVPYPVLKRRGRFVTAPASISRRYRAENFAPVPPDRVIR